MMNSKFHFVKNMERNMWSCSLVDSCFSNNYCPHLQSSSLAINMCISVTVTHIWLRVDNPDLHSRVQSAVRISAL